MSRPRSLSMFSIRSRRKSKAPEEAFDLEALQDPEDFAWRRKYRQSLNDIDLANQFASFMSPELSKTFLDHNKEEFENVLEAKPNRRSVYSTAPLQLEEEPSWQDYDITAAQRNRRSTYNPSPVSSISGPDAAWRELDLSAVSQWTQQPIPLPPKAQFEPLEREKTSSKRQRMLRPMKSFMNFVRRPSYR